MTDLSRERLADPAKRLTPERLREFRELAETRPALFTSSAALTLLDEIDRLSARVAALEGALRAFAVNGNFTNEDVERARSLLIPYDEQQAALASRPQEQPRKATGEMVEGWWTQPEWRPGLDEVEARVLYLNGEYSGHVRKVDDGWVWARSTGGVNFPAFNTREEAQAALIAAVRPYPVSVSPAAPEGWQSVPIKPTDEMIRAVLPMYAAMIDESEWPFTINLWAALLAAAPPSPAQEQK